MSSQRAQMLGVTLALLNLGGSGTTQNVERAAIGSMVRQADRRQTFVVAVAGDIACDPKDPSYNQGGGTANRCHMRATSDLLLSIQPDAVLTLGDDQYQRGNLQAFTQSYDRTWGRLKAVTHPAAGNHEYWTRDAAGYFAYFGAAAGPPGKGYYSFELGRWHLIALNSNCKHIGGCGPGSAQELWLREDLRGHPGRCILAYWHHARFSSGINGSNSAYEPFWRDLYDARADVVLVGHDHHYERFAPLGPRGRLDRKHGIREFVVGTGGKGGWRGFYRFLPLRGRHNPNSQVRNADTFGVLVLTLGPTSYEWSFVPESGKTFSDSGVLSRHGALTVAGGSVSAQV